MKAPPKGHRPGRPRVVETILATWSREELLSLDWSRTNVALGPLLGICSPYVTRLRLALRKKGCPVPKARCGTPKGGGSMDKEKYLKAGIGTVPDRVVAEALGVTKQAVHHARKKMGIPAPSEATRAVRKAKGEAALAALAKRIEACARRGLSRQATARKLRVSSDRLQRAVRLFRIPTALPRRKDYGNVDWARTNAEIAQDLGIKRESVVSARRQLRLRGHAIPRAPYPRARREKYLKLGIGRLPDHVVAERMGVTQSTVSHMRRDMGLPRPHRRRKT